MLTLPGLIDTHVHLRDPGQTHKEDFTTGTSAALAGGFTTILDMPNNAVPVTTEKLLDEKINIAKPKILCDVGFHFGSLGDNLSEFPKVQKSIFGLKVYLNQTTGNFIIDEKIFLKICQAWPLTSPILVHAEEDVLESAINNAHITNQHLHICHISSKAELEIVIRSKEKGYKITCGVTPHHLFLTENDFIKLGPSGKVKPFLKSQKDIDFLWKNIKHIDIIESDHAPHTKQEKSSANPPFGIAGLETTLPLLLTAAHQGKITFEEILRLCHTNPVKIFNIKTDFNSKIEIDESEEWTVDSSGFFSKCKTSPYNGMKLKGRVKKVYLRGTKVFEGNTILIKPGFGKIIYRI